MTADNKRILNRQYFLYVITQRSLNDVESVLFLAK